MMRIWTGRQGLCAIVVVAVTAVWRGWLVQASYFNQDDYYLTSRAYAQQRISLHFLFEPFSGHVLPAQQLMYWLVAHHAPFEWGPIAAGILLIEVATVPVMWHLLSRLLPDRWVRVPLLALFAWTPLTLAPTLWWTGAMCLWPPVLALLLATLFFVRAQDGAGRTWVNLVACVLFFLVGLTWFERGLLAAAVVVGVAVARSPVTGFRRVTHAAARWWALWASIAVVTAGYLVVHHEVTSVEVQEASLGTRLEIAKAFLFRSAIPGVSSGPWQGHVLGGAIVAAPWVEVVAGILCAVAAVLILRGGGRGRWAAALMLGGYVAGDLLMLLLGRAGFGEIIALDPRYTSDVVAAAVVFAAVALEGPVRRRLPLRVPPAVLAIGLSSLYLAGSLVTTTHVAPFVENRQDRRFVENVRAELAQDPEQVLLDRLVPAGIVLPLLGDEAKLSAVLAPLPEHPSFDAPSRKLRAVRDDGHLAEVRIVPVATSAPGGDQVCGHAVTAGETVIPLEFSAPLAGRVVARLQVFIDHPADFEVRIGSWNGTIHLVRGPQDVWLVVPADAEPWSSLVLSGTGPGTLCVVRVDIGPPVASP